MSDGQILRALVLIVLWLFLAWLFVVSLTHGQPMIALTVALFAGAVVVLKYRS